MSDRVEAGVKKKELEEATEMIAKLEEESSQRSREMEESALSQTYA